MPFSESNSQINKEEIKHTLFEISSLDQQQKELVEEILEKHKGGGLLERYEFDKALKELRQKRVELGLSEIDIKNIEEHFNKET